MTLHPRASQKTGTPEMTSTTMTGHANQPKIASDVDRSS
jgi:hypothetical protein